jgi:hypothetical protein
MKVEDGQAARTAGYQKSDPPNGPGKPFVGRGADRK